MGGVAAGISLYATGAPVYNFHSCHLNLLTAAGDSESTEATAVMQQHGQKGMSCAMHCVSHTCLSSELQAGSVY